MKPNSRPIMTGDTVFFSCSNPDAGQVRRIAKDGSWADVRWLQNRPSRVSTKHLLLACHVFNGYLVRTGRIKDSACLVKAEGWE